MQYIFLYTLKLLAKIDKKLGDEIELDSLEQVRNKISSDSSSSSSSSSQYHENIGNIVHNEYNADIASKNESSSASNSINGNINSTSEVCPVTLTRPLSQSSRPPPAPIRQRRRLRRFYQEIQKAGIWSKRDSSTDYLTHQGAYGLKLLGTYVPPNKPINGYRSNYGSRGSGGAEMEDRGGDRGSGALPLLLKTISDIFERNQITGYHLQKLCSCYFGLVFASMK